MSEYSDKVFKTIKVANQPAMMQQVKQLLASHDLDMDDNIEQFVVALQNRHVIGCAGLVGNTLKCIAISDAHQGENLSAHLLQEAASVAEDNGHHHLLLYTKPQNTALFKGCGFYPIVETEDVVLMENTPVGIVRYCDLLRKKKVSGGRIGAIVMNANPFTLGHQWLIRHAAAQCDWLHVFVLSEDVSAFSFKDRFAMVVAGVEAIPNVSVHGSSMYLISRATFPAYFLKESGKVDKAYSAVDLLIFREYLAPALGINVRFVGSEPYCEVTQGYNQEMKRWLVSQTLSTSAPIEVIELARHPNDEGIAISASEVRRLLQGDKQVQQQLHAFIPQSTWDYLQQHQYLDV